MVFIIENESVCCAAQIEYLNTIQFVFLFCKSVFDDSQKLNYLHTRERIHRKAKKCVKGKSTK
jgi:hypothetical protein